MIPPRPPAIALLIALGALAVFHVLMLAGALPSGVVWGGRAADSAQSLKTLEVVGLVVTALFAAVVAARAGFIGGARARRVAGVAMWIVFGYFVLNVLGNLASSSSLERVVFTPVSVIVALLALRVALARSREGRD